MDLLDQFRQLIERDFELLRRTTELEDALRQLSEAKEETQDIVDNSPAVIFSWILSQSSASGSRQTQRRTAGGFSDSNIVDAVRDLSSLGQVPARVETRGSVATRRDERARRREDRPRIAVEGALRRPRRRGVAVEHGGEITTGHFTHAKPEDCAHLQSPARLFPTAIRLSYTVRPPRTRLQTEGTWPKSTAAARTTRPADAEECGAVTAFCPRPPWDALGYAAVAAPNRAPSGAARRRPPNRPRAASRRPRSGKLRARAALVRACETTRSSG